MVQDRFHIGATHPRKPFQKLINRSSITKVLKQSGDRYTRATEDQCTTDFVTVHFHCINIVPVSVQYFPPAKSNDSDTASNQFACCLTVQFTGENGACHVVLRDTASGTPMERKRVKSKPLECMAFREFVSSFPARRVSSTSVRFQWGNGSHCVECQHKPTIPRYGELVITRVMHRYRAQKGVRNRLLTIERLWGHPAVWEDQNDQLQAAGFIMC
jgi:hypothetical protein